MITLEDGVSLVWKAFQDMVGGEIFIRKSPSMNIMKIAEACNKNFKPDYVGIRPGEKLHEQMIGPEDCLYTYEYDKYYKILPSINEWNLDKKRIKNGKKVKKGFVYSSETNTEIMSVENLKLWIKKNKDFLKLD